MWVKRFPVVLQVGACFVALLLLVTAMGGAALFSSQRLEQLRVERDVAGMQRDAIDTLFGDLLDAETGMRGYIITREEAYLGPYLEARGGFDAHLAELRRLLAASGGEDPQLVRLSEIAIKRMADVERKVALRRTQGFEAAQTLVLEGEGKKMMDEARSLIRVLVERANRDVATRERASAAAAHFATLLSLAVLGLVAALGAFAFFFVLRPAARRLALIAEDMNLLGAGRLDHRVAVEGDDEVAHLALAVNNMAGRIEESNAVLDAFAYTVSHDLRAPVRAMQGFSQVLIEDFGDRLGAQGRGYAERIIAAAKRMEGLIQDLLTYSRLSRAEATVAPVPLEAAVDAVLSGPVSDIKPPNARIEVKRPLPPVVGNRIILQQAVLNLVTNAMKFVAPGCDPLVRIRAETIGTAVRLWVEDNGIGIAPEHHQRIFRVFERLHGSEAYPGTGIGLAIVGKALERMGGKAGVESAVGQGSRFWIELPAARGVS